MKSLLKKIFVNNWPRKAVSIILAVMVWFVVNKSLIATKTIANVPVRIENIPPGKTIEGGQAGGLLNRRVNLTITGSKNILEDLTANDIEVVFDASDKEGEWIATINKRNLRSDNPDLNISQGIKKVSEQNFIIKLSKLVTEKIPIIITQPIGEAPKGYQFLDIWPYKLYITVSGPEDTVKKLKSRGLRLNFNLNDISKSKLDDLRSTANQEHADVVSYFVPNEWKQISLPALSPTPIEINDPDAKFLRIDFLRYELLKLDSQMPVALFFPPNKIGQLNPQKVHLANNELLETRNGLKMLTPSLHVKGVSGFFLEIVKDMLQVAIIAGSENEEECLDWSIQFINPKVLENRYVHVLMSDVSDEETQELTPHIRDEYLRNRFRSYMNQFELYTSSNQKFEMCPKLQGNTIQLNPIKKDEL